MTDIDVAAAGTFEIKDLGQVNRLGYGAMRITGKGIWGEPADREVARSVVRRAAELGVDFIDTADSYGPTVSEEIIAEAFDGGSDNVKVATKAGLARTGPDVWIPVGRPEYLRQQAELSRRRLGVERIALFQLHRVDKKVDADEQFAELAKLQADGLVGAIGLSEVSVEQIEQASAHFTVATVQNRFNLTDRRYEDVVDHCTNNGIGFIPWAPISAGELAEPGGPVAEVANELGATPSQVALAWLLRRSPAILPIPGTGSIAHLEENLGAATVELTDEMYQRIDAAS